jgi:hypothetical protein
MRLADESVHVPGGVEWEDNVNLLVSVAHRCGVDAVWPVRSALSGFLTKTRSPQVAHCSLVDKSCHTPKGSVPGSKGTLLLAHMRR